MGVIDGLPVIEAEGQIGISGEQFIRVGSQHPPFTDLAVTEGVSDGQRLAADEHSIFIGSQHPEIGVAEANDEGDGVIIVESKSEQRGSPGVHGPREGSQHRMPFQLISPEFWPDAKTAAAARKKIRRNIVVIVLLRYAHFLSKSTTYQFLFQKIDNQTLRELCMAFK
jgi:hypothetical protein